MTDMDEKDQYKQIPFLLESTKKQSRKEGFTLYSKYINEEEIPSNGVKKLALLLVSLIPNYNDKESQNLLLGAIEESFRVIGNPFKCVLVYFHQRVNTLYNKMSSSQSNGQYLMFPLRVGSCILQNLLLHKIKLEDEEVYVVVEGIAVCFGPAVPSENVKHKRKLIKCILPIVQNTAILDMYLKERIKKANNVSYEFKNLEQENTTINHLALGSWLFNELNPAVEQKLFTSLKEHLVNAYVATTIRCRQKPQTIVFKKCQPLLGKITRSDFTEQIEGPITKALLRNPEVILESAGYLLSFMTLDVGEFVEHFMKVLKSPLHANEDQTRLDATFMCQSLVQRFSEQKDVEKLVKMLFGILSGSDGKLTVNSHKLSLLNAIKKTSSHGVKDPMKRQAIAKEVCDQLVRFLETETHEASLVEAISVLKEWLPDFQTSLPESCVAFISSGMYLKSATTNTRAAYSRIMCDHVSSRIAPQFITSIPSIMKYVDKALLQPSQVSSMGEALSWCTLLIKLSANSKEIQEKVEPIWNTALDLKKKYFTSDRFLHQSSTEVLCQLISLCEILLSIYPSKLGSEEETLISSLAWCLACSETSVRKAAQESLKTLTKTNVPLGFSLMRGLISLLPTIKTPEKDDSGESNVTVSAQATIKSVLALMSSMNLSDEQKEEFVFLTFEVAFYPSVASEPHVLLPVVLKKLDINATEVLENKADEIVQVILKNTEKNSFFKEYLKGIFRLGGSVLYPKVVPIILEKLDIPELLDLTTEDMAIYKTPEDTIYDQQVVDEAFENELNLKNVKRSTKTYSHEEELMMLADKRKALEEKRKAGKLDLTPKQKEVVKNQLEKEAVVRNRVKALDDQASDAIFLLEAISASNMDDFGPYMKSTVPVIIKYLPSKLVDERLSKIFHLMRTCAFDDKDIFGEFVGWTTIRIYNPRLTVPLDWDGLTTEEAAEKVLQDLYDNSLEFGELDDYYLNAAGLVYCFPILKSIMAKRPKVKTEDGEMDETSIKGLSILRNHVTMRGSSEECPYHPKFMPRLELLNLLVTIISTRDGRVQQTACAILQDLCACAAGNEGCDRVTQSEISVLLSALTAPAQSVRDASLRGLNVLIDALANLSLEQEVFDMMTHRLWVARHDQDESIMELATTLWEAASMEITKKLLDQTISDITHSTGAVRMSAGAALAVLMETGSYSLDSVVARLIQIYKDGLEVTPAKEDQYGRIIEDAIDHWQGRSGVALALERLAPHLKEKNVIDLTKFFVPDALGDRQSVVRKDMLAAAMAVINLHGKKTVAKLLPVFEKFLNNAPKNAQFDAVRQSVVVLMGSLAKHLDTDDPKIKPIVAKLVEALSTPSQQVQEAVANCLYPLVPCIKEDAQQLVKKLMHTLLESNNYGHRKGSAYGLAALVKGLGILYLKQLDIMNQLTTSIQNKKVPRYREGALIAIEQLCNLLGKLFEPYIVFILPDLLLCFGDTNVHVRQAANDTAKAVMSKLSSHGVKLVLPSLLAALEEDSWRTKTGSIELLGNMAFCAPKQLSSCLPSIVPRLIGVLSDSHLKVQKAGASSLRRIGSVIRNPEIQAIVPVLLEALQDPSKNTSSCLQTLLETKFIHFIDAPSLALIMPVVERSFQDRSTEVRKMSAQIIGNMYSLTDQKDLAPYLPNIIPGLKTSLLDPVPKVRSVSARALGAMVRGMGESSFDDLLPWLMQTLTSEASPVDRSGAAQGLAEVVGGLGPEKLHRLMPDIVATAERQDIAPQVKDGYIMMFIFLPTVFEKEFTQYIGQIIPSILKALADENEYVRDTALRAGQRIVNTYAETAVTLLLPELENGLFHANWRIRYSSVQLLGDLLYRVSGVSGKMTTDTAHEDDNFGTEQSQKAIMRVLGEERRNRVLAGLYMGRSDLALMVRQAALHVWKVVVTNTPKTLREILPTLFSLLLGCLASTSYDKRQVAARTLGDLVRKLGERILPEIIPILESGLDSDDADRRQGVCIGLSEIMASTSRDNVLCFTENLVTTVRRALCDPLPQVREAGAHTFDSLHGTVGSRALDDILKPMLVMVQQGNETSDYALDGLKQVMTVKSRVVLPYLVPQLTAPPVNTEALCILASVAGEALTKHLPKILPALIGAIHMASDEDGSQESTISHCQDVILAVNDNTGVNIIVDELLIHTRNEDLGKAKAAAYLLMAFCSSTQTDYSDYVPQLIRGLLNLFTSKDKTLLQTAWSTLTAVTKSLDASEQRSLVNDVRQSVKFAASDLSDGELMPGFCLPKGIQPILPIFREAILNGEADQKEAASSGLTEIIRLTSSDSLKVSVVHITGPLIRVLGDRFDWHVKAAVLDTLALLLEKAGAMLKPFLPQLQTTFVKSVSDPHRGVRLKAGHALSKLIVIHTKPDPLFTELHNLVKTTDDSLFRETTLQALRSVIGPAGSKMSETVVKGIHSTVRGLLFNSVEAIRLCAASIIAVLFEWLPEDLALNTVSQLMSDDNSKDMATRHGKSGTVFSLLLWAPTKFLQYGSVEKVSKWLVSCLSSPEPCVAYNGVVGIGFLILHLLATEQVVPPSLAQSFGKCVNHVSNDVKQAVCRACQYIAEEIGKKSDSGIMSPDVAVVLIPHLVNCTKEKNPVVRSSAECALIAVLQIKSNNGPASEIMEKLDKGSRESLMDTLNKNLKKVQYIPLREHEADPSWLT